MAAAETSIASSEPTPLGKGGEDVTVVRDEPAEGSEEFVRNCIEAATELKQEATEHFRAKKWNQALATYSVALGRLPKRVKEPEPYEAAPAEPNVPEEEDGDRKEDKEDESAEKKQEPPQLTGIELECAKLRAVLNANIGACHVKLEEYKEAVTACTEALADDPNYIKALQRRASCNEKIGSWSSLASAQEDYNTLLKLLPPDSPQVRQIKRALEVLKPHIEEAQKRETAEVLGKLKDMGNSILGKFGLSTDNFKFDPNGQGGYSMNFVR